MKRLAAIAVVLCFATVGLTGCLLSGPDYIMSYGVEASTDDSLNADAYTFNVTISGR